MNVNAGDNKQLDDFVRNALSQPMPRAVECQLRQRIEKARKHVSQQKQHLLTRRRLGWVAVAAGASAAAVAVPLFCSSAPPAWAEVANSARDRPWMHFAGQHFNGTRLQFWVSPRHGIHAMKAGNAEFVHFQSKATQTRHWYRASEGVIHQEAYRRPPGELGYLETLLERFSAGAKTVEIPGPDKILAQSRREVVQDGDALWEYEFTLKAFDQGHADTYIVVFQVDPETRLPRRWTRKPLEGSGELSFDIDYPSEGPKDIFALGVPRTAKVVNRN